jgi:hypothetical protein
MKKSLIITYLLVVSAGIMVYAKTTESPGQEQEGELAKIIESGKFIFEARRAFPQRGQSIDLSTNYGYIKIADNTAEASLPYFGRVYHVPYGGRVGIAFSGEIRNQEIQKKNGRRIIYSFEVRGDDDNYNVTMDIHDNGDASVNVTSRQRSRISYQGNISGL